MFEWIYIRRMENPPAYYYISRENPRALPSPKQCRLHQGGVSPLLRGSGLPWASADGGQSWCYFTGLPSGNGMRRFWNIRDRVEEGNHQRQGGHNFHNGKQGQKGKKKAWSEMDNEWGCCLTSATKRAQKWVSRKLIQPAVMENYEPSPSLQTWVSSQVQSSLIEREDKSL